MSFLILKVAAHHGGWTKLAEFLAGLPVKFIQIWSLGFVFIMGRNMISRAWLVACYSLGLEPPFATILYHSWLFSRLFPPPFVQRVRRNVYGMLASVVPNVVGYSNATGAGSMILDPLTSGK